MKKIFIFLCLCLIILVAQCSIGFLIFNSFEDWSNRGTFGDMFGAVNTMFSGFAFAALTFTLYIQQREMVLQRKDLLINQQALNLQQQEMELSREELKRSADSQVKSSLALLNQSKAMIWSAVLQGRLIEMNAKIAIHKNSAPKNIEQSLKPFLNEADKIIASLEKEIS